MICELEGLQNFYDPIVELRTTKAGAQIFDCINEAFELSFRVGVPVHFIHNEIRYIADGMAVIKDYMKQNCR